MKIQSILIICLLVNQSFAAQPTRLLQTQTTPDSIGDVFEYQNYENKLTKSIDNLGVNQASIEDAIEVESNSTKIYFDINYVQFGDTVTFTFNTQTRFPPASYMWMPDQILASPMRVNSPDVYNVFKQSINLMTQNGADCENPWMNWLNKKPIEQTKEMIAQNPQTFDPMTAIDLVVPEAAMETSQMLEDSQADLFTYQNETMTSANSTYNSKVTSQKQNISGTMDGYTQTAQTILKDEQYSQIKQAYVDEYQIMVNQTELSVAEFDGSQISESDVVMQTDYDKINNEQGQSPLLNSFQQLNLNAATIDSSTTKLEEQTSIINQDNSNILIDQFNKINDAAVDKVRNYGSSTTDQNMMQTQNTNAQNLLFSSSFDSMLNVDLLSQANVMLGSGGKSVDYDMLSKIQSASPIDQATQQSLMEQLESAIPANSKMTTVQISTSMLTPGYTYSVTCNAYDSNSNLIAKQPFIFTVVATIPLKTIMTQDDHSQVTLSANCANQCDTVTINWKNVQNLFLGSNINSVLLSVGPLLTLESDNDCLNQQVWSTTVTPTAAQTSADILINDPNVVGTEFYVFRLSVQLKEFPKSEFVILKLLAVQQNTDNLSKCTSGRRVLQTSLQNLLAQQQQMQSSIGSLSNPKLNFSGSKNFQAQSLNNQNFVQSADAGLGYSTPTDFLIATQGESLISYLSKNSNYMEAISLCKSSDIYESPFLQYKAFDESTQLMFISTRQSAASSNQIGCGPNGDCFAFGTCNSVANALRGQTISCECIADRAGKFCQYTSQQALNMQNQQTALIANVAKAFGIDLDGSIDDDISLISDPLAGSQLVLGMVQSGELTQEQLNQVVLLVNALVSGPNVFISNEQFTNFKGALGGLLQEVAGSSMMTKAQRRNQLSDSKLDQIKDKYVTKSVIMALKSNLNVVDTSLGNEVGSLSVANSQSTQFTLSTSITDQSGNLFQAPSVQCNKVIKGMAYTNLVGSGCADSVINCNLDQAVISMDVLDIEGEKIDVSGSSITVSIPLNGDAAVNKLKSSIFFKDNSFNCQYWDTDNDELSTDGVTTSIQGNFAVCTTTHLTSFTAGSYNADESFVGIDEMTAYKSFPGAIVLIYCIIQLMF